MAETLLDNLHNDQAETKSILENTPNENFAAQPVEPEQSTEYTLDELQGDLAAKRGVQEITPATALRAPQPEAKETPLTTAQPTQEFVDADAAQVTPVKKSNIMNFSTGEYLDDNVSDRQKADYLSANRAFQRIIDLYDSYDNPTIADLKTALGEDATAFNKVYGSRGQNWADALGANAFGVLTKESVAKINDLVNAYRTRQGAEKQAARDQAVAEYENQYKVKYGDNEIAVDKEFSDNIKSMVKAAMRSAASVNDNSTPEQIAAAKAEQAKIANDIKSALEAKGVAFDPNVPINGINDIVNAAAGDYITKDAVGDILDKAMSRTEYTEPEEMSLDDRIRKRAELKELVDARSRAGEIQRAKSRTGMVGIAALIGDMIRASEGAPVSQRDYQRIYDNLDAQARANINNYNIRMQKIKDDANRMRLAQMNLAARQAEKDAALAAKAAEGAANRESREKVAQGHDEASIKRARIAANKPQQPKQFAPKNSTNIDMFGKTYEIDSSQNTNTLMQLYGKMKKMGLDFGIKDEVVGLEKEQEIRARVLPALQSAERAIGGWMIETGEGGMYITDAQKQELEDYVASIAALRRGGSPSGVQKSPEEETPANEGNKEKKKTIAGVHGSKG